MRIGLLGGRILPLLVLLELLVLYYLYVVLVFHRRDRPPSLGVSSKGSAAESWRFIEGIGRRVLAFQPGRGGWGALLDCRSRLFRDGCLLGRDDVSIASVDVFVRRLACTAPPRRAPPAQRSSHAVTAGDIRGEAASRVNGVHLPRRRRRAAPACEWRQPATPHAHHSRRHEAVAAAAAPLFSGPALRSGPASEPGATPALTGLQRHGGGVFTHTPPPPSLGSLPVDLSLREVSSAPAGAAQSRPSGARREPA